MVWDIRDLNANQKQYEEGKWGPAKPIAYSGDGFFGRFKSAMAVLIGSAAAVKWYK